MAKKDSYDWLDDPFDPKKDKQKTSMGSGSKAAVGIGCVLVFLVAIVLLVVMLTTGAVVLSELR